MDMCVGGAWKRPMERKKRRLERSWREKTGDRTAGDGAAHCIPFCEGEVRAHRPNDVINGVRWCYASRFAQFGSPKR